MTQIAYALGFLLFDRETGRVRPSAVTGLIAAVLAIVSHLWLGGPWLQQAGFPGIPHSPAAAASTAPPAAQGSDRGGAR